MNKLQTQPSSTTTEPPSDKPRRLGRGLSALLGQPVRVEAQPAPQTPAPAAVVPAKLPAAPSAIEVKATNTNSSATNDGARVEQIALDQIRPSRFQPRKAFDDAGLAELAASIKSAGVVQPVVVRRHPQGQGFELIAGERRWRAAKLAGLARVPAVVTNASDSQAAEWALIENLQRADLKPMERADAVRALIEKFNLSHAQAAEKIGIDRSSIANLVRMTELEMPIRELLDSGALSAGHGKALLSVAMGKERVELAKRAAAQGWSVRRLEQSASVPPTTLAPGSVKVRPEVMARAAAVKELEKQLGEHMGTNVRIRAGENGKRGTIVIRFYDLDHFDGLMQKFGFAMR